LGKTVEDLKSKIAGLLTAGEGRVPAWWEAADLLSRESMKVFVKPLLEAATKDVGGRQVVLRTEKEVFERVRKDFPGEDWPGEVRWKEILSQLAVQEHAKAKQAAAEKAKGGPKAQKEAAASLDAYRDALPEPPPERTDEVAEALRR